MLISKTPPVIKKIEKSYDFINWKFYAGLMSNNTYSTKRAHTYTYTYYIIAIADTGNYVDWRAPICELYYNCRNEYRVFTLFVRNLAFLILWQKRKKSVRTLLTALTMHGYILYRIP